MRKSVPGVAVLPVTAAIDCVADHAPEGTRRVHSAGNSNEIAASDP
jgi:hypothetical protein